MKCDLVTVKSVAAEYNVLSRFCIWVNPQEEQK